MFIFEGGNMLRTAILPIRSLRETPSLWGIDSDINEAINDIWRTNLRDDLIELKETENAFLFSMDMPGVNKEGLDVEIRDEQVFIEGRRVNLFEEKENHYAYKKVLSIPRTVDQEKIQAKILDGVFYIALPKVEKAKPKKIEVSSEGSSGDWKGLLDHSGNDEE